MWKVKRMNTARIIVLAIALGAGGIAAYLASGSDPAPVVSDNGPKLDTVDVLVARSTLPAHPAGLYAGGLILVKAVLFLPQFVIVLAFPALASGGTLRRDSRRLGLALVGLLGVAVVAGTALLPRLALVFVGGDEYAGVRSVLWQFAVLGTALSLLQVLVYDIVAGQDHAFVAVLWIAVVVIAASGAVVDGTEGLLHWVLAVDVVATVVLLALTDRRESGG